MDVLGFIGHRLGVSDNMKNANFLIWKLIVLNIQDQANQELILNAKKASHATPLWKSLPAIVDILRMGASGRLMLAVFVINQLRNNLSFHIGNLICFTSCLLLLLSLIMFCIISSS